MMTRRLASGLLIIAGMLHATVTQADHTPTHMAPVGPAKVAFPADFPALTDSEWGFALGGFGGEAGARPNHVPVIFVHGNNTDACDWNLVREQFAAAGWNPQSLWALSYNGVGNTNLGPDQACKDERVAHGSDGVSRITANDINVADLHAFILAVRAYTGSPRFSLVSHSLGVTLARKTLRTHPALRQDLVAFVGIAGGNHGTSLCPPGSESTVNSCDEIAPGTPWLAELNGTDGADETYAPARWMTVYDGSGAGDVAYLPPLEQSPVLKGADNREFPGASHAKLRDDAAIVATYRAFLEAAEAELSRPASGAALAPATLLALLAAALRRRGRARSGA